MNGAYFHSSYPFLRAIEKYYLTSINTILSKQLWRRGYSDYFTNWTMVRGLNPGKAKNFSPLENVQIGSGVHPAFY